MCSSDLEASTNIVDLQGSSPLHLAGENSQRSQSVNQCAATALQLVDIVWLILLWHDCSLEWERGNRQAAANSRAVCSERESHGE